MVTIKMNILIRVEDTHADDGGVEDLLDALKDRLEPLFFTTN